jgi:hypothetical protein
VHSKDIRINGIDIDLLPGDVKRSLVQRINAWAKANSVGVSEPTPPIRTTKPKAKPESKDESLADALLRLAEALGVAEAALPIELTTPPERRTPERTTARRTRRTTTRRAPARRTTNRFFEEVIVPRAESKTHECSGVDPATRERCYKYGKSFTDFGWFGTPGANNGHVHLASRFHPRGR